MMRDGRIRYFAPADYTEGSQLDVLVKSIIDATAANERLEASYFDCKQDTAKADAAVNAQEREKANAIIDLEGSGSFARTHAVIAKLRNFTGWTPAERETLIRIARENSQVQCILSDGDVRSFYKEILQDMPEEADGVQEILAAMADSRKKKK